MLGYDRRSMDAAWDYLDAVGFRISGSEGAWGVLFADQLAGQDPLAIAVLVDTFDEGHPEERAGDEDILRAFRDLAEGHGFTRGDVLSVIRRRAVGPSGAPQGIQLVLEYRPGTFIRERDGRG